MNEKKIDVYETDSNKKGLFGFLETLLRSYRTSMYMAFYLVVAFICFLCFSFSFASGFFIYELVDQFSLALTTFPKFLIKGGGLTLGLLFFGLTLMLSTIVFNLLFEEG